MRKTSRTFLKVGAILGIILGVLAIIGGIVSAVIGKVRPDNEMLKPFYEIINQYFKGNISTFQNLAFTWGITIILCGICSIVSSVFAFIARNKPTNGMFITVIVLSACGGSAFATLGGIFGLIANAQERRAKLAEQPQDNQAQ